MKQRALGSLRAALAGGIALLLAATSASATDIQEVTSPGGITAWLVEEHSVPVIAMEFSFLAGSSHDPAGKAGLANMVSGLLNEGAGEMDALAYQTRVDELALNLDFDVGRDEFSGSIKALSERREESFEMLRLALSEPRFDEAAVERVRLQILSGLNRKKRNPQSVAWRTWYATMFPDHPYGRPVEGTEETVGAIVAADLHRYVEEALSRDTLVVSVVGDITPEALGPLLDRTFGALAAERQAPAVGPATVTGQESLEVVEMPVPQSVVAFGGPGLKRTDPDWYAAYLLNYKLGGGGLTSRLTDEVREERGLAYSVYSYLLPLDLAALHVGGVATQNARVGESLDVIRQVLRQVREEGLTAEELADAKTYVNGSFPLRLTSSNRIAGLLVAIQRNDLGIDYLDRRQQFINAVTLEDIRRVAKRLLHPDGLTVVVVGSPQGLNVKG